MKLEVVTPPTEEPVTLDEAKLHLRVDGSDEDALITSQIKAARLWCEEKSDRSFVDQKLRLTLDAFPIYGCRFTDEAPAGYSLIGAPFSFAGPELAFPLPRPKVTSIVSVSYVDVDGDVQTMDPSGYTADLVSEPAWLRPAYRTIWPATLPVINSVKVEYQSGYGSAAAVDERAKVAIKFLVGHWYANREAVITGTVSKELELTLRSILGQLWHGYLS